MKIEQINLKDLIIADYNPRINLNPEDKEYQDIKNNINMYGMIQPFIVNIRGGQNKLVSGHQRLNVLKELGYEKVDCVLIDVPIEDEKSINIAMNKITGKWDMTKLNTIIEEVKASNTFNFTGFSDEEVKKLKKDLEKSMQKENIIQDDNFDPNKIVREDKVKVKLGQIYHLGNHVLMCGDSFNVSNILTLLDGQEVDMLLTDPPYNMSNKGAGNVKSIENFKKRIEDIVNFDVKQLSFLPEFNFKSYYIFTSKDGIRDYLNIFDSKTYKFNMLMWGKTNPIPWLNNQFYPDIEYLMYFATDKRIWNNSLKPTEIYKKYYISKKEEGRKEDGDLHPTMKPIELLGNRILISSNENGIVLDLFGGSGSTLIAAEKTNRKCFMMEINPLYCEIIIERYKKLKGHDNDIYLIDNNKKIPWKELV